MAHQGKCSGSDECRVKSCCENKKLENCGFCDMFPCDLLKEFAYDKEEGDDGARIKQCECWAKNIVK